MASKANTGCMIPYLKNEEDEKKRRNMKIRKERRERIKMKKKTKGEEEENISWKMYYLHSNPYVEYTLISNKKCLNIIMQSKYVIC